MDKDNAKKILDEVYKDILAQLDHNREAISKDVIIDILQQASSYISKIDFDKTDAINLLHNSLDNHFEKIAEYSLEHYSQTNQTFKDLTEEQGKIIQDADVNAINTQELMKKFSEIQLYMLDEANKANNTINKLKEQMKILKNNSDIDFLTKTLNRRALSRDLEKLCNLKHERSNDTYALMIDIDDFKKLNDTYGHLVGDKVLIFLSGTLKKILRDSDKIYRYGGEEFTILLNRTTKSECMHVTNRILTMIQNSKLIYKDLSLSITVSIGVTNLADYDVPETFIDRADTGLYKAKTNGKNQIVLEEADEH